MKCIELFKVINPGLQCSFQDAGRPGYRHLGIPASGYMDSVSAEHANRTIGNPHGTVCLEFALIGPTLEFTDNCLISICGAYTNPILDNKKIKHNHPISVQKGQVLKVGRVLRGVYGYIGFKSELELRKSLNSYATLLTAKMGGFNGRILQKGDVIRHIPSNAIQAIADHPMKKPNRRSVFPPNDQIFEINMHKGPEYEYMEQSEFQFAEKKLVIDSRSNRFAIILSSGERSELTDYAMKSSGIFPGVVQLNYGGEFMIIMNDGQTTGGYPRIGIIDQENLSVISQVMPGTPIKICFIN